MTTKLEQISTSEAIILQELSEAGEEDVSEIASELHEPRGRILALLNHLKNRGLIIIRHSYGDTWVLLSSKGKRTINYLWPEFHTT